MSQVNRTRRDTSGRTTPNSCLDFTSNTRRRNSEHNIFEGVEHSEFILGVDLDGSADNTPSRFGRLSPKSWALQKSRFSRTKLGFSEWGFGPDDLRATSSGCSNGASDVSPRIVPVARRPLASVGCRSVDPHRHSSLIRELGACCRHSRYCSMAPTTDSLSRRLLRWR